MGLIDEIRPFLSWDNADGLPFFTVAGTHAAAVQLLCGTGRFVAVASAVGMACLTTRVIYDIGGRWYPAFFLRGVGKGVNVDLHKAFGRIRRDAKGRKVVRVKLSDVLIFTGLETAPVEETVVVEEAEAVESEDYISDPPPTEEVECRADVRNDGCDIEIPKVESCADVSPEAETLGEEFTAPKCTEVPQEVPHEEDVPHHEVPHEDVPNPRKRKSTPPPEAKPARRSKVHPFRVRYNAYQQFIIRDLVTRFWEEMRQELSTKKRRLANVAPARTPDCDLTLGARYMGWAYSKYLKPSVIPRNPNLTIANLTYEKTFAFLEYIRTRYPAEWREMYLEAIPCKD